MKSVCWEADIVCQAVTQNGVVIGDGGVLRLNGHSISGGNIGLVCAGQCTIEGPGEVMGFADAGIASSTNPHPKIDVRNVSVHDNLHYGIVTTYDGRLWLTDVTVSDNNFGGITLGPTTSAGEGKVKGTNVVITGNDGPGVKSKKFRFVAATIQGNDGSGILSGNGGGLLIDSTVTGNGTDFDPSYDLKTYKQPRLKNSTCELSVQLLADASLGASWGVCTND